MTFMQGNDDGIYGRFSSYYTCNAFLIHTITQSTPDYITCYFHRKNINGYYTFFIFAICTLYDKLW